MQDLKNVQVQTLVKLRIAYSVDNINIDAN